MQTLDWHHHFYLKMLAQCPKSKLACVSRTASNHHKVSFVPSCLFTVFSHVFIHTYSGLNSIDLSSAALICIGNETEVLINQYRLPDSVILHLRVLACTMQNTRWEQELCGPDWGLDCKQARMLSTALLTDIIGKKVCSLLPHFQYTC